jgi:hypothetical protein
MDRILMEEIETSLFHCYEGNVRMNYSQLSSLHVECIFYKHGLLSELLRPAFEIFANPRCQAAGDLKGSLP